MPFNGSSENLTLTERYTRTGPDTLEYQFTVDDPTVWTRPWTGMYTFVQSQYELVECRLSRRQLRDDQHPEWFAREGAGDRDRSGPLVTRHS